jgi:16S rRNA (uracil1498-N3)-methyltransferase
MARIYTPQSLSPHQRLELLSGPSRHLAGALRRGVGDAFTLFNGDGGEYPATIDAVEKKHVQVTLGERADRDLESPLSIHLGIAISRGERMDWVIQKSTELGVTEITPLFTARTEVKLKGDRADKKRAHWQQIAISACEQCGRNTLPQINPLTHIESWCGTELPPLRLVLHHRSDSGLPAKPASPMAAALLIGPEGGLSEAEVLSAQRQGFEPLTLGPRVLRTETAPLAAIAILQAQWGDMI